MSARRAWGIHQFAENDERVNAGWPAYEEALKKAGVQYTAHHYPGTNHGFHNDTTPRYEEAAAKLAWQRTLEFFNKELAGKQAENRGHPASIRSLARPNPFAKREL